MRSGELRHRVTIQHKVATQNAYGEEIIDWQTWKTAWAAVEPLTGREFMDAERAGAEVTHRIRIRQRDGLLPSMRVSWDSRLFDIESVLNLEERDREMQLMCREVVDE